MYKNTLDLQLAFIRIYIGVDFFYYALKKLGVLGYAPYHEAVVYFSNMGFHQTYILIAGICELAAFIGFTFGLFTRLAALCATVYLIITLFAGQHHVAGFTWTAHTSMLINGSLQPVYGGVEYPLFWAFICLTFVLTGGRRWSLDSQIRNHTSSKILNILCK